MILRKIKTLLSGFPVVLQHDISDCGAACLSSILAYYGKKVTVARIRDIAGTLREGTTGLGLVKAARELGLSAKGVKASSSSEFPLYPMPFIAHVLVDGKRFHYIIVYAVKGNYVKIMDPAQGLVKMCRDEFESIFLKGIILIEPKDLSSIKESKDFSLASFVLSAFKAFRMNILFIIASSIGCAALGVAGSYYIRYLMDWVISRGLSSQLTLISSMFIFAFIAQIALGFVRNLMMARLSVMIDKDLMMNYFRHVLTLPMNFFISRKDGEIISRFTDAAKIREAISSITLTLGFDTLIAVGGGVFLFLQNVKLFFVSLGIAGLYAIVVIMFNSPLKRINRKQMENNALLTSHLVESLKGIETLKALNAGDVIEKDAHSKFDSLNTLLLKGNRMYAALSGLTAAINGIGTILILWFGTQQVLQGKLTAGELLSFNVLLQFFLSPVKNLIDLSTEIQSALAATSRLGEVLELESEKSCEACVTEKSTAALRSIEIDSLTFNYGHRKPVLNDISLKIYKGEKVALVGESGSGKTTLARLLLHYYTPECGAIKYNGIDMRSLPVSFLRSRIAYLPQETFLLSGSIRENISLGCPGTSLDAIIEACKKAHCHEFIESLPSQYDTRLEENGANLSGGQRQRLALARAFLKKPDILILDEATSHLDTITENAIGKTIETFDRDVIQIIIAHRLSTIKKCDRIFVLEDGHIVQSGSHDELLSTPGLYRKLWEKDVVQI